jgi:hypothetical protein
LEQKLRDKYQQVLERSIGRQEQAKASLMPLLGLGLFWIGWNVVEHVFLNYQAT